VFFCYNKLIITDSKQQLIREPMDKPCFELKGSLFTLTVLQLFDNNLSLLETQLKERVKMAPGFFNQTPVVIDFHELTEEKQNFDFIKLRKLLLSLSIIPIGVKCAAKSVHDLLEASGMVILAEVKKKQQSQTNTKPASNTESITKEKPKDKSKKTETQTTEAAQIKANPVKTPSTMVVKQTIRSGRQVYAPGSDLIIIGSVSAGAEILADGNIHVYGTLRGRALAGVRGDQSTSIFCHSLQAELISIAGIYLISEDIPEDKIGQTTQTSLEEDKIQIEVIA